MAQDDYIRTALRVPPSLHKQIHEAAKAADRTFNAEILSRLQGSFQGASTDALVMDQAKQIFELRRIVAIAHVELAMAAHSLQTLAPQEKAVYERIRETMKRTGPDAQTMVDHVFETLRLEREGADLATGVEYEPDKIIIPRDPPKPASKGPVRSTNARKPKP
jgi:hypothetical protein